MGFFGNGLSTDVDSLLTSLATVDFRMGIAMSLAAKKRGITPIAHRRHKKQPLTMTTTTARWWTAMAVAVIASFIAVVPVTSYVPLLGAAVSFKKGGTDIVATATTFSRLGPLAVSTEENNAASSTASSSSSSSSSPLPPPPILNGKRIFPVQVLMTGLKGHENRKIPAVYALFNQQYKRGSGEGWDNVIHVGVSQDFYTSIKSIMETAFKKDVFHVRALSFSFPEPNVMQEIANEWKQTALAADAKFQPDIVDASLYLFDDDEDDDDDDWDVEMTSQAMATAAAATISNARLEQQLEDVDNDVIVSPFANKPDAKQASVGAIDDDSSVSDGDVVEPLSLRTTIPATTAAAKKAGLDFTRDSVDIVLNEIRPYLIADGGNATVESVDESTKTVYLKLLGACGTCPSSTVTMQMGIERVLRENFGNDVSVSQITDNINGSGSGVPTELTFEAVQQEVQRLSAAVIAMGGVVRIVNVDAATGVVQLNFRGANKVQKGLELALLDVPFVNAVQFVMGDDDGF